jgi:hypothetical protein
MESAGTSLRWRVTEKALQVKWWCSHAEALRVNIHVRMGGVGIYMRSSRRSLAAVVIKGAGTALRWRVTKKALQASK